MIIILLFIKARMAHLFYPYHSFKLIN